MMALSSSSMLVAIHGQFSSGGRHLTVSVIVTESSWIKRNRHAWVRNNYTALCVTGHTKH